MYTRVANYIATRLRFVLVFNTVVHWADKTFLNRKKKIINAVDFFFPPYIRVMETHTWLI